ncbi:amino acid ABC transporter substrate-binding protein, PAAT family [Faunimonas pinastri]|uniref:Amino acid ABC transporter substrate-binding protein, PAAT family n=1 Tax=Faunimonas pinastri TaxID=1855383 RepID=A0A1H9JH10_9HYPH|nr:ABC transporter substrate-binding protein [Faunimonas pinastri]SEQ86083.1 amino acid ABC transporter substrate-binding protein, PAAT family [Faunimonas pinastri]
MSFFRSLALAAAAMVLATGVASAKDWTKVRFGTEGAYPPFNQTSADGKLVGFDIDIGNALCDKMKVQCEWVVQDWDGIIPALQANKFDAVLSSMSITDERKKIVSFSDKYYTSPIAFMAPKDAKLTDISPASLAGKTIGTQSSTISANYLQDLYGKSDVKLYPTQDEANLELGNGRLDVAVADKFVAYQWLQTDAGKCCDFVGKDVTEQKYVGDGIGIAFRKDDEGLKDKVNKALAEIRADGTYAKINAKYFPFSIYGDK